MNNIAIKNESIKTVFDFKQFLLWVLSVFFSTFPLIFDGFDYLLKNGDLDKKFFNLLFVKGDILCIIATLSVMTFVDYLFNKRKPKSVLWKILLVLLFIFLAFIFWLWIKLYSISEGVYDDNSVIWMTLSFVMPAMIICAILQGGAITEVEE